jgi:hypothetical protein
MDDDEDFDILLLMTLSLVLSEALKTIERKTPNCKIISRSSVDYVKASPQRGPGQRLDGMATRIRLPQEGEVPDPGCRKVFLH